MWKAIQYLISITEESYFLKTVSLVCHLKKNYTRKGHTLERPVGKILETTHNAHVVTKRETQVAPKIMT